MPKYYRSETGSGIAEGVVGIGIVVGAIVVSVLFIINVSMAMHLKNTIGFMAEQAARYAVTERDNHKRHQFVRDLAAEMGLARLVSSEFGDTEVAGKRAARAKLTSRMRTFGKADWLPRTWSISDSAVYTAADSGGMQLEGYSQVQPFSGRAFAPNRERIDVPIVKIPQNKRSVPLYAWDAGKSGLYRVMRMGGTYGALSSK